MKRKRVDPSSDKPLVVSCPILKISIEEGQKLYRDYYLAKHGKLLTKEEVEDMYEGYDPSFD